MSPDNTRLDCWIFSEVEDHFIAIWELVSTLRQRQPTLSDTVLYQLLTERLQELVDSRMVAFYQGYAFNGDEVAVVAPLPENFIAAEAQDWRTIPATSKQLKLYITERGRQHYLATCKAEHFQ